MLILVGNDANHTGLGLSVVFHLVIHSSMMMIVIIIIIIILSQCKLHQRGGFNFSG